MSIFLSHLLDFKFLIRAVRTGIVHVPLYQPHCLNHCLKYNQIFDKCLLMDKWTNLPCHFSYFVVSTIFKYKVGLKATITLLLHSQSKDCFSMFLSTEEKVTVTCILPSIIFFPQANIGYSMLLDLIQIDV